MNKSSSSIINKFTPIDLNQQFSTPPAQTYCSAFCQRSWLKSHGKEQFINFSEHALKQLRKYFDSLDEKENGSIGVQELQDPFIAFGLSQTRDQVQQLIDSVDLDGSGKIQFDEFLAIMLKIKRGSKSQNSVQGSAIFDFFQSNNLNNKELSKGSLGDEYDKNMSFKLNVSQFRRRKILESIMSNSKGVKDKGTKITQSFKRQVMNTPQLKQVLNESKKSNVFMHGFDTNVMKKK